MAYKKADRLNPTDATLWEIKRDPELRTTIVAVGLFESEPDWDRLTSDIQRAVTRLPRLRQRIVGAPFGAGRPHWDEVTPDLDHHIRRTPLEVGDLRSVLDLGGQLAGEDFDEDRPLWQVHLIDGGPDHHGAIVIKVSHALTDGIGGIGLLRAFGSGADDVFDRHRRSVRARAEQQGSGGLVGKGLRSGSKAVVSATRMSRHPRRTAEQAVKLAASAARLMAPTGEPCSPLMTERGAPRWLGITEVPLAGLRKAAHRAGGTINDALVTVAVSALADYHAEKGAVAERLRVTLPVNIRPANGAAEASSGAAGNHWAPARLVLEPDPTAHPFSELQRHRRILDRAIHDPAIPVAPILAAGLLELPGALTTGIVGGMVKGSDLAISDVPGMSEPLEIAGTRLTHLFPFAPTGGAALNVALLSHGDHACVGMMIDKAAVEDPEALVRCFDARANDFLRRRRAPATNAGLSASLEESSPKWDRLSALDTSFLRLESECTPMHMGGLFILSGAELEGPDGELDMDRLTQHVANRLERIPSVRRKLREIPFGLSRPVWVEDETFDVANHVHHLKLDGGGTWDDLVVRCEALQMELLDRSRPLFDLTFISGLDSDEFGPGAVALVERVHHALLDGMSGVEMFAVLFDTDASGRDRRTPSGRTSAAPQVTVALDNPSSLQLVSGAIVEELLAPIDVARSLLRSVASPRKTAVELGRVIGATRDLVVPKRSAPHPLNHVVGGHRRLEIVSLPMDLVNETRLRFGGTVNELVLTVVSSGVRSLLETRGVPLTGPFTALVPVSTRTGGLELARGNHVAAITVDLPVGSAHPEDAFPVVVRRIRQRRRDHHADGSKSLLRATDHLPAAAIDLAAWLVAHQSSVDMVVTNMAGPSEPLFLCGSVVEQIVPILPLGANLTLGLAVLSYNGSLVLAFHGGADACEDLGVIADATRAAFDDLVAAEVVKN